MNRICTEPRKKIPINIGAIPVENRFQYLSFITKYTIPTIKQMPTIKHPNTVATLRGIVDVEISVLIAKLKYLFIL